MHRKKLLLGRERWMIMPFILLRRALLKFSLQILWIRTFHLRDWKRGNASVNFPFLQAKKEKSVFKARNLRHFRK